MNKNKTAETIGGVMQPYGYSATYDEEDRLATWTRDDSNLTQSWNLSPVGDWTSFTENAVVENRTHGPTHELTAINSTPMTYDAKGNLTTNSNGQTYTWDFDNMMATATVPVGCSDGIEGTHNYGYDALGRRVSKTVDTETRVFVCRARPATHRPFAGQVFAEYSGGAISTEPLEQYIYAFHIDEPVMKEGTGGQFFYHANALFSNVALTNEAGAVVERTATTPYGASTTLASNGASVRQGSSFGNSIGYTGRMLDVETRLYYHRARYYDGLVGVFTSRDSLAYLGGSWSLYHYADSDPLNHTDPTGMAYTIVDPRSSPKCETTITESLVAQCTFEVYAGGKAKTKIVPCPSGNAHACCASDWLHSFWNWNIASSSLKLKVVKKTKCWQSIGGATGLIKNAPCTTNTATVTPGQAILQIGTIVVTVIPIPITTTTTTIEEVKDKKKNCNCFCNAVDGRGKRHGRYQQGWMTKRDCLNIPNTQYGKDLNYVDCHCDG